MADYIIYFIIIVAVIANFILIKGLSESIKIWMANVDNSINNVNDHIKNRNLTDNIAEKKYKVYDPVKDEKKVLDGVSHKDYFN